MKSILRTADERFDNLTDYDFEPNYFISDDGVRIHYLNEGRQNSQIVLLMHGEPSWSYLYRNIIPPLVERGFRVLAPDLVGFGRSDKPALANDYTYERHVSWMSQWFRAQELKNVTLFCQDWGGLIGLRLVAQFPDAFSAVIASNTGLPEGYGSTAGFDEWLEYSQSTPTFSASTVLQRMTKRQLAAAERDAYDAPFPDESFKAAARVFPTLVPIRPDQASAAENRLAWTALESFEKPFVTAFSDGDPITSGVEHIFQARIPGTKNQAHVTLTGGHFIQEDDPQGIVELIARVAGCSNG